jgi:hypothetical protein
VATLVNVVAEKPLKNPPPAGSPWEEVEKERLRRNWSQRELSRRAAEPGESDKKSETHYGMIAHRNGWEKTELATLNRFRRAVGLPPLTEGRPVTETGEFEVPALRRIRKEVIQILVREGHDLDDATEMVDQLRGLDAARADGSAEPDPVKLAHFARHLLIAKGELGTAPPANLELDKPPGKPQKKAR